MINRIKLISPEIKVSMLLGSESWIDNAVTEEMEVECPEQFTVHTIAGAGHHVYADRPYHFNKVVNEISQASDNE